MSFDTLAPHYSWMEWVLAGRKLQRCRTAFLEEASRARNILLVGEGHGRFLLELCRANPEASICCVDASSGLTEVARQRLRKAGLSDENVCFRTQEVQHMEVSTPFDLVVTQFFLDCFQGSELEAVIGRLAASVAPGGDWILSDFQIPPKGWPAVRARFVLALAYGFFRVATRLPARRLTPPAPLLSHNGLHRLRRMEFNFQLLYSELWHKPDQSDLAAPSLS